MTTKHQIPRMGHQITLQQAVHGYNLYAGARHLSQNTIDQYNYVYNKFLAFVGPDIPLQSITHLRVQEFLASFHGLSNTTLLHMHVGLSALWTWAVNEQIVADHVVHRVKPPKPDKVEILPFTEIEFRAMLAVLGRSKAYTRPGKRKSDHSIKTAERSRAMMLMLLDTGLRASELCSLKLHQVDNRNNRVQVTGKGARERSVPFSPRTAQALWRYLTSRPDARLEDPLFITSLGRPLDRNQLRRWLEKIGKRAGIQNVHPHRFRHTFAIQYLRNGGDPYTLQVMLGHEQMEMVKKYLALAQIDIDLAHRRASPVDNWVL